MKKSLNELNQGQKGKVLAIEGGSEARKRLEALGLRIGKIVTKQSAMIMKGPITVKVDNTVVGIAHGIASKVIVKLKKEKQ